MAAEEKNSRKAAERAQRLANINFELKDIKPVFTYKENSEAITRQLKELKTVKKKNWRDGLTIKEISEEEARRTELMRTTTVIVISCASIICSVISILMTLNIL